MSIVLLTPPTGEPVSVGDLLLSMGLQPFTDETLAQAQLAQFCGFIAAARSWCEDYCRRVFVTSQWQLLLDNWPHRDRVYRGHEFREPVWLPKPPFQSIQSVQYVDVDGTLQTLPLETDYGVSPADASYAYQLDPGSTTRPARLAPAWARPWPPLRDVQNNVIITFTAGYGGNVSFSLTAESAVVASPYVFQPSDAGTSVTLAGAGASGAALTTTIATVADGVATLATPALTTAANVQVYLGEPVPVAILQAIKFLAGFYYKQGSEIDMPMPRVITDLLGPYVNRVA